jgi:hypothetical protein
MTFLLSILSRNFSSKKSKFTNLTGLEDEEFGEPQDITDGVNIKKNSQTGILVNVPDSIKEVLGDDNLYISSDNLSENLKIDSPLKSKKKIFFYF